MSVLAVEVEQSWVQPLYSRPSLDTSITGNQSPEQTWPISHTPPLTPSFIKGLGSVQRESAEEEKRVRLGESKPSVHSKDTHAFAQTHMR